ncbi:hypothetical protein P170DRAFT_465556 [Aspergillus steynii IBT 23096]|uniref:SPT2-domain-containing protein n=1 Tax=Aspergillus steynii IBT 23096 TaxID=1392250 RepID=A0A2I2G5C0_9EURO|nr:uncharacterized protein P170DRAFT_465556 [Aspergillus steynii IBT 23096]PLB48075.1 hypothetical protein P170DRAFT_465556 [Aspergillus steynii IBT 23096]
MSFLDSVLSSIETGKPSRLPPSSSSLSAPVSSSNAKSEVRKPSTTPREAPLERKTLAAGTKRKAEEQLPRTQKPDAKGPRRPLPSRPAPASTSAKPRPTIASPAKPSKPSINSNTSGAQKPASASSKAPPKGSYADLMMKAKALQDKAPSQVGMFKHQAVPKEKLSKVERKKKTQEAQTKGKEDPTAKKSGSAPNAAHGKPVKKREPEELAYKGTAKPPPAPALPEYRGTAGLPSRVNPQDRKSQGRGAGRSRMNEYLGTDEEDEGEYADDYDDYYSDASSDMEGGFDDVEEEEAKALAAARREDEEEWRAEQAAKQDKLDRRNKLAALAARRR